MCEREPHGINGWGLQIDGHRNRKEAITGLAPCRRKLSVPVLSAGVRCYRSPSVEQNTRLHCTPFLPSTSLFSPSQHEPCPTLTPTLPPPPPSPTFNWSSMPHWTRTRRRQKPSFSLIPLRLSSSPATHPPPFHLSLKTSSSNSIAVAGAMRG